ncbi:MAG: ROK family protein [Actinomycetota bacterium]
MRTIGIDLGGTKTLAVLVEDGQVVEKAKKPTPRVGEPADVINTMVKVANAVDPDGTATAIGIGVPGPVVPGTGVLPAAPNLPGWDHDVPVADLMSERLGGRPVVVDNDVNVGTLAEHRLGAGKGVDDLLGVFAGTGVGAGLILDGELRQGPRGLAGEIGHIYVAFRDLVEAPDGLGRGELEDYAGRNALERRVIAAGGPENETLLGLRTDGRLKSKAWAEALKLDDPLARELVDQAGSALAAAMATVITLLDVERVVLGGGFAERLGEPFRLRVEAEVAERAFAGTTAPVVAARLGDVGGAIGAALLVERLA